MFRIRVLSVLLVLSLFGCQAQEVDEPIVPEEPKVLRLTTTTSVNDSGLMEYLRPHLLEEANIEMEIVSMGSGAAIEAGQRGDADVLLVHSPAAEKTFVEEGYGIQRSTFMYNFFVIVGPESDPAGVKDLSAKEAFMKIREAKAKFVSRGDNSGTHSKEKAIWKLAELDYDNLSKETEFYVSAGTGMGATLTIASEQEAYTLTDLATYLSMEDQLSSKLIVSASPDLRNDYSVIVINPDKVTNVDAETAKAFETWMLSDSTLKLIAEYGKDEYGEALFFTE
ncbi:MAG TPA: tungsten ABC transporter substrate-binding protein [Erysipelotrichaceae bacterium]|nr:tungsten ABC transporter substrate-binding protein [Erysipelotrichaceae bacterium]